MTRKTIAGMMVTYANIPATLSVMPPVLAVACGIGGAVAARPAQAAQVVVPSAICVPHMLQKAIGVSSSVVWREACGSTGCARPLPSDAAARYQKGSGKAIDNFSVRSAWEIAEKYFCTAERPSAAKQYAEKLGLS